LRCNVLRFFFQAEDGIRDFHVTGVQTCALPISKNLLEDFNIVYNPIELPKIDSHQTSFTDAILVDNKLYFLATAEKTSSTYHDEIGRASCRERVKMSEAAVSAK